MLKSLERPFHQFFSYFTLVRRVALRQKPFFKGPSDKNVITIYSKNVKLTALKACIALLLALLVP